MKKGIKIDKNKIKTSLHSLGRINKKTLKNGSYSMIYTVILIAVIIVINLIVGEIPTKYTQIDVSTQKLYTISDKTREFLDELDQDVTIYHIVQNGMPLLLLAPDKLSHDRYPGYSESVSPVFHTDNLSL